MAKFKVGDRVAYYGKEPAIYRKRGKVSDVSQIRGETFVTVDLDDGEEWGAPEKDWAFMNSIKSTNAVVAKALNACGAARNAMDDAQAERVWSDFQKKVGALKREADTLRAKFRAEKHWAYADQMGYVIEKLDDAVFK